MIALLPLYRGDEDFVLCDMGLGKCNALAHAIAEQNGTGTVWADEAEADQSAQIERAREIMRSNFLFRDQ